MKRLYFDYAATTPVDPRVIEAMKLYWNQAYGNPGSLHWFGQQASAAVFKARQSIAQSLGCHYSEIVFTGSATEANNLALQGVIIAWRRTHKEHPKIIISAIEHDSISETTALLEQWGVEIVRIPVNSEGIVDSAMLEKAIDERTVLVSIIYVHNEIGVIQPITDIAKIIKARKRDIYPLFHTDAVQAFNYLECRPADMGVDLLTLSSQKIYGPKGIGLLYVRKAISHKPLAGQALAISPIITGGGQEGNMRSGTENVSAIVGFAKAVEVADRMREKETKRVRKLQHYCEQQLHGVSTKIQLNSMIQKTLPHILNVYIPQFLSQELLVRLDLSGIAISSGSACSARSTEPSSVAQALGYSKERASRSVRISFGRPTTQKDIDSLIKALRNIIRRKW